MAHKDCGCNDDFFARSRKRRARTGGPLNPREAHDKTVIMRHYRMMDHRKTRPEATIVSNQVSRSCGDQIKVFIDLDAEGKITQASYQGEGCSVSIASTSIMCAAITGLDLATAACLSRDVQAMLGTTDDAEARVFLDFTIDRAGGADEAGRAADVALDDVLALWSIRAIAARIPCALLAWNILPSMVPVPAPTVEPDYGAEIST